jgi:hypothetical protein
MELSKNYIPGTVEEKWYKHWMAQNYFKSKPDNRPPFTIVIPPPNVTGVLHMGHTLNETVQDILIRKARMSGFNACWVPGSDHASIATEAKVVDMLKREKGIDKNNLSREEFLKYAFEWKEKYGNIIYNQIERLGCSVDWDRVSFTMDDHYYKAVIKVFVDLYKKGLIYRGARMINWDPAARTALSDEEVEYKDVIGKLYYIKYGIAEDENDVFFVQGYLHAKFRLWQMEFQTRAAAGRLSEILGPITIDYDRDKRRLGMVYAAENSLKEIEKDPETLAECNNYTAGVNAYIESLTESTLPIEYKLLGYHPEKWTNLKSALFLKYMALELAGYEKDFEMTNAKSVFSAADFDKIYPIVMDSLDPIVPKDSVFPKAQSLTKSS